MRWCLPLARREDEAVSFGAAIVIRVRKRSRTAAFSLVEAVIASGLVLGMAVAATHAMLNANRIASANRVMTAARAVVQRNIDLAMTQRFDSTVTPAILAITGETGTVHDDDGGADDQVNILTIKDSAGNTLPMIKGELRRTVTAVSNAPNADVRQVVFRLSYVLDRRPYVVEMSTFRALDD